MSPNSFSFNDSLNQPYGLFWLPPSRRYSFVCPPLEIYCTSDSFRTRSLGVTHTSLNHWMGISFRLSSTSTPNRPRAIAISPRATQHVSNFRYYRSKSKLADCCMHNIKSLSIFILSPDSGFRYVLCSQPCSIIRVFNE